MFTIRNTRGLWETRPQGLGHKGLMNSNRDGVNVGVAFGRHTAKPRLAYRSPTGILKKSHLLVPQGLMASLWISLGRFTNLA
jgi:hypothetical protein